MIVEDLLWRFDPVGSLLPEGLQVIIDGGVVPVGWQVSDAEAGRQWECRVEVDGGAVEVVGSRAVLFAGRVVEESGGESVGGVRDLCRGRVLSWDTSLELTMLPGFSDPGMAGGYAVWEASDG
ncbi:MAG: hypothetical protein FWD75_00970 [Propionibacteriaceae bacterium]|nr:hypothetical protein [Propionibacteriaceae bacterium]